MQELHFPGCWVVESRDNTLSAPGIYSLCAVLGKSHMWVNPLLKQVSTTELPQLWLCSSFVEGCRALSQGWQMGIAMGRCWLLACPEFQPHWSVSMVISELCLGRHLLWVVFWKVKLKLIAKAWAWGAGLGGWGCCPCKWLCQFGSGVRQLQRGQGPAPAAKGHCGKQILAQQILAQLLGGIATCEVCGKKRSLWCRWADRQLHTGTRHSRGALEEQPHRGGQEPQWSCWLGQAEPKLPEHWGRVSRAPGWPKAAWQCHRTLSSATSITLPPGLAASPGLGNEPAGKGSFICASLNLSPFLPYLNWYKGIGIMMNWETHFYWGLSYLFLNGGERMGFWDNLLLYWFITKQNSIFT